MLGDTLTISWNAVNKVLPKINNDSYSSVYRLDDIATTGYVFTVTVKNGLPDSKTLVGETHLLRLDAQLFSAGKYVQTVSVWMALQNNDGVQDKTATNYAAQAIAAYTAASSGANMLKILGRES